MIKFNNSTGKIRLNTLTASIEKQYKRQVYKRLKRQISNKLPLSVYVVDTTYKVHLIPIKEQRDISKKE